MTKRKETPHKQLNVIAIDDDQTNNRILEGVLSEAGHNCTSLLNAATAREYLERIAFQCDVILLDLVLPDARGEDFLEWIKVMSPKTPVIIISGESSDRSVIKCLNKGACDYLEKPFDIDQIVYIVEHAVIRQEKVTESYGDMQADMYTSDWVELTSHSEMEYLGRIQRFSEILFRRRLPKKVVDDLRLAMEEFGRNAIEWGNRFEREKMFRISYCFFPGQVVLKFEDEGEGFIPSHVPDPSKDPIAHLKNRQKAGKRPGGFGIFMMKQIMDDIFYNQKGNICIMTKYLPELNQQEGAAEEEAEF